MANHNLHSEKGFSIIELMIVVAIIGILAAVAVPAYISHFRKARQAEGIHRLLDIKTAQEKYYALNDIYADNLADLDSLVNFDTTDPMFDFTSITSPSADFRVDFLARSRNDINDDTARTDCWAITNTTSAPTQIIGGAAPFNVCVEDGEGVNISIVNF